LIFAIVLAIGFLSSSLVSNVNIGSELLFDKELPNFIFGAIFSVILFPIVYFATYMVEYVWYEYKISQYNLLVLIREEAEKEEKPQAEETANEEITL
jgi:hypothetical protein